MSEELNKIAQEMASKTQEVKAMAVELKGMYEHGDKVTQDLKDRVDDALTQMNEKDAEVKAALQELMQKSVREDQNSANRVQTLGGRVAESEEVKSMSARRKSSVTVEVKAGEIGGHATGSGAAGALVNPMQLQGIVPLPEQKLTVRDLLLKGRMDSDMVRYAREKSFTNNAATVAELADKPYSEIEFEAKSEEAKVIAHLTKASLQILSDASQLASHIDGRLRYGLRLAEERQLLNGDGTGSNISGLMTNAAAYVPPAGATGLTAMDTLRFAHLQATLAGLPASASVISFTDWALMETLKDSQGRYIIGNPQGSVNPTMWGLPLVTSQSMQTGKFLVGAFNSGAQLFDRWDMTVEISTQNDKDFEKNLVTIRAEERLALAIYVPDTFVTGNLAPVSG